MCVYKNHAFIYFMRPPPWYGTVLRSLPPQCLWCDRLRLCRSMILRSQTSQCLWFQRFCLWFYDPTESDYTVSMMPQSPTPSMTPSSPPSKCRRCQRFWLPPSQLFHGACYHSANDTAELRLSSIIATLIFVTLSRLHSADHTLTFCTRRQWSWTLQRHWHLR